MLAQGINTVDALHILFNNWEDPGIENRSVNHHRLTSHVNKLPRGRDVGVSAQSQKTAGIF